MTAECPGSSGTALPHLVVEIRDGDTVLPVGETGEITVRAKEDGPWGGAYRPMLGYLGHPDQTAQVVRDDVLYTGDVGCVDPEGRLFVRDRRNALILRGGANVYPAEVERVLLEVPGVRGASVVGVPDERLGQLVAAAVESEDGHTLDVDELSNYCSLQLARYKVPERWKVGSLPRNAMGKVVRTEIEQWFAEAAETPLSLNEPELRSRSVVRDADARGAERPQVRRRQPVLGFDPEDAAWMVASTV